MDRSTQLQPADPMDQFGAHLARSSTLPSHEIHRTFSSQSLRRKRFSLQDGSMEFGTEGSAGGTMLPDASGLLVRPETSAPRFSECIALDAAHRRASCGLLSSARVDGPSATQARLVRRRTSAPSNAQHSDSFAGMSSELALAAQRFLNSTSEYSEGPGVEEHEWLPCQRFGSRVQAHPAPVAPARNPFTDPLSRKSPQMTYNATAMQPPQQFGSSSGYVNPAVHPGLSRQVQPPRSSAAAAASMILHEGSVKPEDVRNVHAVHANQLSVAPLSITPLPTTMPLDSNRPEVAARPISHSPHVPGTTQGLSTVPTRMRAHPPALLNTQHPAADRDMEGLWQLVASEAELHHHLDRRGGAPQSAAAQQFPLQPSGGHMHALHPAHPGVQQPTAPHERGGGSVAPPDPHMHPAAAALAHLRNSAPRNIGEAFAAVEGNNCGASFSIYSDSSGTASSLDLPPALAPTSVYMHANSGCMHAYPSGCGWNLPNPTCDDAPNPADPPSLLLNSGRLDG